MSGNFDEIYFRTVVEGGLIEDKSFVATWFEIGDIGENVGKTEGFYCMVYYEQGKKRGSDLDIQTF